MQSENRFAFKEWAVICQSLAEGRQSLIVRKGGIHEGRAGFRVEHGEFWLFPTFLHQVAPDSLVPEAQSLLARTRDERPPHDVVRIRHYAVVEEVHAVSDAGCLPRLASLHIWSHRTLDERFHYRQPGLFVLPVRVFQLPRALELPDSPHFAGCRTWVDLPRELSTSGAEPVLTDVEFKRHLESLREALNPPACV